MLTLEHAGFKKIRLFVVIDKNVYLSRTPKGEDG